MKKMLLFLVIIFYNYSNCKPVIQTDSITFEHSGNYRVYRNIGIIFDIGSSVDNNYMASDNWSLRSAKLYSRLVELGDVNDWSLLRNFHRYNVGVEMNYTELNKWRKSLEDGNMLVDLGSFYEYDNSIKQDYTDAVKWHHKLTEPGNTSDVPSYLNNGQSVRMDGTIGRQNMEMNWGSLLMDVATGMLIGQ